MKITYWNCRGIKKTTFWTEIDSKCKNEHIQIMALAETKSETIPEDKIWKTAGFDEAIWSPASGRSGGLGILWKSFQLTNEIITVEIQLPRIIGLRYENINDRFMTLLLFVYAPPGPQEKDSFWETLTSIVRDSSIPCIVLGDLNEILCSEDKLGGANLRSARFTRLLQFKNDCALLDLPTFGNPFTWRKNPDDENTIREKLDRVLVHHQIIQKFPNLITHNGAFSSSDHCPI